MMRGPQKKWNREMCRAKIEECNTKKDQIRAEIMAETGWNGSRRGIGVPLIYKERVKDINRELATAKEAYYNLLKLGVDRMPGKKIDKRSKLHSEASYLNATNIAKKKIITLKEAMMQKYNWNGLSKPHPEEYRKLLDPIYRRYNTLRRALGRKQHVRNKETRLVEAIEEFMGYPLTSHKVTYVNPAVAHGIFIKYGMETGLTGAYLMKYLGVTSKRSMYDSGTIRTNFTKSFQFHPENRELYHRFKSFMSS